MGKVYDRCFLVVSVGIWICLIAAKPETIDDTNLFFKDFVNHELLNVLGVIVAITLASAANLHLQFNELEDAAKKQFLVKTRRSLTNSVYLLILIFGTALLVVILKPISAASSEVQAFFNGLATILLIVSLLTLVDISRLVFKVPSKSALQGSRTGES